MIRFREDPVRMMRAVKFAARLDFKIERGTEKAIRKLHSCILTASTPRLCAEVFRLFTYGTSEAAFRMMHDFGLLGDLLPDLDKFIDDDGGRKSSLWTYLSVLDRYEKAMKERGVEANPGRAREMLGTMAKALKVPKSTYFTAVLMIDSVRRLSQSPQRARRRFVYNRDFPDALDFNRIVARAEGRDEKILDQWDEMSRQLTKEQGENHE